MTIGNSAMQKLVNIMGPDRARALTSETLLSLGLRDLGTADDCLRFGDALVAKGGIIAAVGRAIKIQAILNGAIER